MFARRYPGESPGVIVKSSQSVVDFIPAGPYTVSNVVNGAGNVPRITLVQPIDANLKTGQVVTVQGIAGATGSNGLVTISAINLPGNWIETSGTFGGTYTAGGLVFLSVIVTALAGTGGSPAGGGWIRVTIDWLGVPGF